MFHLKLRRTEHATKEFNIMRGEERTGIVGFEFERVSATSLHAETRLFLIHRIS
jgi:hypothetical protein